MVSQLEHVYVPEAVSLVDVLLNLIPDVRGEQERVFVLADAEDDCVAL